QQVAALYSAGGSLTLNGGLSATGDAGGAAVFAPGVVTARGATGIGSHIQAETTLSNGLGAMVRAQSADAGTYLEIRRSTSSTPQGPVKSNLVLSLTDTIARIGSENNPVEVLGNPVRSSSPVWIPNLNRVATYADLAGVTYQDGMRVWVSSEQREYVRVGGAWKEGPMKANDTDWQTLGGWSGGFAQTANPVQIRVVDGYVEMRGSLQNDNHTSLAVVGTIPVGFRPEADEPRQLPMNSTANRFAQFRPNG